VRVAPSLRVVFGLPWFSGGPGRYAVRIKNDVPRQQLSVANS